MSKKEDEAKYWDMNTKHRASNSHDAWVGKLKKQIYRCLDGYQPVVVEGSPFTKSLNAVMDEIVDLMDYLARKNRINVYENILHDLEPHKTNSKVAIMSMGWYKQHSEDLKALQAYRDKHDKQRNKEMEIKVYGSYS